MPELPEVETVKRALERLLPGRRFVKIETFKPALRLSLESLHDPALLDVPVTAVRRRARYLIVEMANARGLLLHFGMTGTVRVVPAAVPRLKHEHVVILLDNGDTFRFEDPRRFGFIQACELSAPGADPAVLADLGPEPLDETFDAAYLHRQFKGVKQKVKTALMDNAIVVGVGNIYANESLFLAGVSPLKEAGKLTLKECRALVGHIKETLRRAIAAGGTTISDFKGVDGSEGKFVQQLNVYGRNGEPCPRCRTVLDRTVIGGRGTFFCSKCQK